MKKIKSFDILGNIAIVNFPSKEKINLKNKKKLAENLLKEQKPVKTVLEKIGKVKGRLRKISTRHLAGEKTKEVLYKENNCIFRFNVDNTYFSPRLSNERKEIASKIKKNETVLVMFAGVSPFSIVIAKNSKAKKVYSNEINRKANKYGELNIELNKLKEKVELIPGDIKRVARKLCEKEKIRFPRRQLEIAQPCQEGKSKKTMGCFDVIVMPRPQLKDSFLEQAFKLSKKNTLIYYYDFCKSEEKNLIINKIKNTAKENNKKIKILNIKKAGEIAPYKLRVRVDFKVLN